MSSDWEALEQSDNPFAFMVRAHIKTMQSMKNVTDRLEWKTRLSPELYTGPYRLEIARELLHMLEWMMTLLINKDWNKTTM